MSRRERDRPGQLRIALEPALVAALEFAGAGSTRCAPDLRRRRHAYAAARARARAPPAADRRRPSGGPARSPPASARRDADQGRRTARLPEPNATPSTATLAPRRRVDAQDARRPTRPFSPSPPTLKRLSSLRARIRVASSAVSVPVRVAHAEDRAPEPATASMTSRRARRRRPPLRAPRPPCDRPRRRPGTRSRAPSRCGAARRRRPVARCPVARARRCGRARARATSACRSTWRAPPAPAPRREIRCLRPTCREPPWTFTIDRIAGAQSTATIEQRFLSGPRQGHVATQKRDHRLERRRRCRRRRAFDRDQRSGRRCCRASAQVDEQQQRRASATENCQRGTSKDRIDTSGTGRDRRPPANRQRPSRSRPAEHRQQRRYGSSACRQLEQPSTWARNARAPPRWSSAADGQRLTSHLAYRSTATLPATPSKDGSAAAAAKILCARNAAACARSRPARPRCGGTSWARALQSRAGRKTRRASWATTPVEEPVHGAATRRRSDSGCSGV